MQRSLEEILGAIDMLGDLIINLDGQSIPLVFSIIPEPTTDPSILEALHDPTNATKVKKATGAANGLFGKFKGLFDTESSLETAGNLVTEYSERPMRLHLLCQKTWKPVGEGYVIKTPRETVPKLLPLLNAAVTGMKVANGVAKIGHWFGLPSWAEIPEAWVEGAESAVNGLDACASEYRCVAEAAGGFSTEEQARKTELSDFQVREFKKFVAENDPVTKDDNGEEVEEYWADLLVKVVTKKDGRVLWVSEEGKLELEAEAALDTQATEKIRKAAAEEEVQRKQVSRSVSCPHAPHLPTRVE